MKSGSTDLLKRFRAAVKRIVMADTASDQIRSSNRSGCVLHEERKATD